MGVLHTPTLFQTIPGFYSLTETVKTKGTLLVRDTRESTFIQLQNVTKIKWRQNLISQNFILKKGSNFMRKIEWVLMWEFYELNHIKFLNHVNLWLKINFQSLAIYLKSVTCIILDGDGSMSWSVDNFVRLKGPPHLLRSLPCPKSFTLELNSRTLSPGLNSLCLILLSCHLFVLFVNLGVVISLFSPFF